MATHDVSFKSLQKFISSKDVELNEVVIGRKYGGLKQDKAFPRIFVDW